MEVKLSFSEILKLIRRLPKDQKEQLQTFLSEEIEQEPQSPNEKKRTAGGLKGFVTYMSEDFDAPLEDMEPYME